MAIREVQGALIPAMVDTPLDSRTVIAAPEDIRGIELPYVGMLVYCRGDGKTYRVESLAPRRIGMLTIPDAAVGTYSELGVDAEQMRGDMSAMLQAHNLSSAAHERLFQGKLDRPQGGVAGQVLTKTADGEAWLTPAAPVQPGTSIRHLQLQLPDGDYVKHLTVQASQTRNGSFRTVLDTRTDYALVEYFDGTAFSQFPAGGVPPYAYGMAVRADVHGLMQEGEYYRYRWFSATDPSLSTDWSGGVWPSSFTDGLSPSVLARLNMLEEALESVQSSLDDTALQDAIAGKADLQHTHAAADIAGLQTLVDTAVSSKMDAPAGGREGQVLTKTSEGYGWASPPRFDDAPSDGKSYVRRDGQWVEAVSGGGKSPSATGWSTAMGDTRQSAELGGGGQGQGIDPSFMPSAQMSSTQAQSTEWVTGAPGTTANGTAAA